MFSVSVVKCSASTHTNPADVFISLLPNQGTPVDNQGSIAGRAYRDILTLMLARPFRCATLCGDEDP